MGKMKLIFTCLLLATLIIMLPICLASDIKVTDGVLLKNVTNNVEIAQFTPAQAVPVTNVFPGLGAAMVILLAPFVEFMAIGAAIIIGGYFIYRIGYATWVWYTAYEYEYVHEHAYIKHITVKHEFENIWGNSIPPKKDFDDECIKNMNSKTVRRFNQVADKKSIAYNTATSMLTVGATDGKLIITCFEKPLKDVEEEILKGRWVELL